MLLAFKPALAAASWTPSHVVVVVEENHAFAPLIGNAGAPYINALAAKGTLFTDSHAIEHPSQPNYLDLFSGSNQGARTNALVPGTPLTTPNLGAALIARGLTFTGYSEGLPEAGSLVAFTADKRYARKHNPWSNWQAAQPAANQLPPAANQPLTAFPKDFNRLPTVAWVIPDQHNDMHGLPGDLDDSALIARGDRWLKDHIGPFADWAVSNNSLLILTFDEDDGSADNRIVTIFVGSNVKPGRYSERIDHFRVLRTVAEFYDLGPIGKATGAPITDAFVPSSSPGTATAH